jgi:hypothetical protein
MHQPAALQPRRHSNPRSSLLRSRNRLRHNNRRSHSPLVRRRDETFIFSGTASVSDFRVNRPSDLGPPPTTRTPFVDLCSAFFFRALLRFGINGVFAFIGRILHVFGLLVARCMPTHAPIRSSVSESTIPSPGLPSRIWFGQAPRSLRQHPRTAPWRYSLPVRQMILFRCKYRLTIALRANSLGPKGRNHFSPGILSLARS